MERQRLDVSAEPAYQPFLVTVARKERLSPHFMCIVFTGPELGHFADHGYGQHVKLILPLDPSYSQRPQDDALFAELLEPDAIGRSAWWDQWRALPVDGRNAMRTYTIRSVDECRREVAIDFVVHPGAGPAGSFALSARVGDAAVLIGPNSRSPQSAGSLTFAPAGARTVLLAGDETAAPAICSIAESLERDGWQGTVSAFIEVPEADDVLGIPVSERRPGWNLQCHWVVRGCERRGDELLRAVGACCNPSAPAPQYAWIAAEAATTRALRRMLTGELGMAKSAVTFYSYWREGHAEL